MEEEALAPVVLRSLAEHVASKLRRAILDGTLRPGARLVEQGVAERLAISRGPVREAFRRLAGEGLIELHPHRGAVVTPLDRSSIEEIRDLRSVLEPLAAKGAVRHLTDKDLGTLEGFIHTMEAAAAAGDAETLVDADLKFHTFIWERSGNRRLHSILASLSLQLRSFILASISFFDLIEVASGHYSIFEALRAKDRAKAESALRRHIAEVGEALLSRYGPDHS